MSDPLLHSLRAEFRLESLERIGLIESALLSLVEADGPDREEMAELVRRELHTLKGNAGMMGLEELRLIAHAMEDDAGTLDLSAPDLSPLLARLDQFRKGLEELARNSGEGSPGAKESGMGLAGPASDGGVRIPFSALDSLMDLLSEMVIFRNRLTESVSRGRREAGSGRDPGPAWSEVAGAEEALGKTLGRIQDSVTRLRMIPMKSLHVPLQRLAHDESERHGKQVSFRMEGGETPLDKALLEMAGDALGHLIRNAIVHGLEPPEVRRSAGKKAAGTVRVQARVQNGEVLVAVSDDGGGINRKSLEESAQRLGIERPGDYPLQQLMFLPGLTTHEGTDMSAGRGVGLSAVEEAVRRQGGRIELDTRAGSGTTFLLRLPLSVSITQAMLLRVEGELYALPLGCIVESLRHVPEHGHQINHAGLLRWRGELIPLMDLAHSFENSPRRRDRSYVIVFESNRRHRALLADDLVGVREIVMKSLDEVTGRPPGVGGSTILGDGHVVLILDPAGLAALDPFSEAEHEIRRSVEIQHGA